MGPDGPVPGCLLRLYCAFVGADPHEVIDCLTLATPCGENSLCGLFHYRLNIGHCETCASIRRYRAREYGSHLFVIGIRVCVIPSRERAKLAGECIAQKLREKWDRFRGRGRGRGFGRGLGARGLGGLGGLGLRLGLSLCIHGAISLCGIERADL